ncbi:cystatin-like [Hyla sarda]|uniref:cystatin-like n=1 Tax=Hyla sarda TaxID=327740 RepID=UPI0024C2AC49|nr:cystatin-like [Hyla sarda]
MTMLWKISVVVLLTLCVQVFAQNKKLLGGWRDVDENDEYTQDALRYAKKEYNKSSKDGYITDIIKIIRLRKQVVAGMKYSMEVEAVISPCPEDEMLTEECQNQETKTQRCSFEVLDVPWRKHRELRKGYCNAIRN